MLYDGLGYFVVLTGESSELDLPLLVTDDTCSRESLQSGFVSNNR